MYLTINSPLSWEEHSYFTYFLQHSLLGMKWYNLVRKSLWNCYWQMICLKHFSQNQNYVAMIAQMASIISLHTSQNPTEPWWHYMGGGCARIVKMFLQGVSWGGHAEFRLYFFLFLFALVYFSWKEMLQNSSHVTPEQREMSEQILSEVIFWHSEGQSEFCKSTLSSAAVVIFFSLWCRRESSFKV